MALSTAPIAASGAARASVSTDAELIELGSQLDEVAAQLDAATPANVIGWDVLNRFGEIYDKILTTESLSVDGLRVKARLACWIRLGDFDNDLTDGAELALSIVRDLIRLYDPQLERPGALTVLLQEIEQGASLYSKVQDWEAKIFNVDVG